MESFKIPPFHDNLVFTSPLIFCRFDSSYGKSNKSLGKKFIAHFSLVFGLVYRKALCIFTSATFLTDYIAKNA